MKLNCSWLAMPLQKMRAEMKETAEKLQPVMVASGARETHAPSTQLFHILVWRKRSSKWVRTLSTNYASARPKVSDMFNGSPVQSAPSHILLWPVSVARESPVLGARRGRKRQRCWRETVGVCVSFHADFSSTAPVVKLHLHLQAEAVGNKEVAKRITERNLQAT